MLLLFNVHAYGFPYWEAIGMVNSMTESNLGDIVIVHIT